MTVRRGWTALIVAAGLFAILAGAAGFVGARDEAEVTSIPLPMPRPGDQASYAPSAQQFDGGWGPVPYTLTNVRAQWDEPIVALDANAAPIQAALLRLRADYQFHEPRHESATHGEIAYALSDRRTVSLVNHEEFPDTQPGYALEAAGAHVGVRGQTGSRVWVRADLLQGYQGPCGFLSTYHGGNLTLDRAVHLGGSCDDDRPTGDEFRYDGRESIGGVQAFRFQNTQDPEVRVWYAPGLAFPIQVRDHFSDLLDSAKTNGWVFTWTLTGFEPGAGAYPPAAPDPAGQPLAVRPLTLGAPDTSGIQLAIPYEVAFEAARTDPDGFGPFLQSHPDAYVGFAWLEAEQQSNGMRSWGWYLLVTDGHAWTARSVRNATDTLAPGAPALDQPPALPPRFDVEPWAVDLPDDVAGLYPERRAIPQAMPAAADAFAAFRAATFVRGEPEPERLSFEHQCWGDCEHPRSLLHVGVLRLASPDDPLAPPPRFFQDLVFSPDGRRVRQVELTETLAADPLLGQAGAAPQAQPADANLAPWQPPSAGAVAAVGLLAILAGLLAYAWPVLKAGGGLGLFSRIQDDRLLDHKGRAMLLQAIEAEPGIHLRELSRRTGIATGALRHHLDKMRAADLVVAKPLNGYLCYFLPTASRAPAAQASAAARSPGARLVLESWQKGHLGVRDIAAHTGLAPSTVSHHLAKLRAAGALGPQDSGVPQEA